MISTIDWLDLASHVKQIHKSTCSTNHEIPVPAKNVVESIQNEFEKFEKLVVSDCCTQHVVPENMLKFPRTIIHTFSKIFNLWYKNPILKKSIDSEMFYDIFSLMFQSFNNDIKETDNSNGTLDNDCCELFAFCDICDEGFSISNNDVKSSYAKHTETSVHIEAEHTFRMIGKPKADGDNQLDSNKALHEKQWENDGHSSLMIRNNNKYIEMDKMNPTIYICHLCKYTFNKDMIVKHETGEWHRYQERLVDDCYRVIEENHNFVELIDERTFDFECYLCDYKCRGYSRLIEHCRSTIHNDSKLRYLFSAKSRKPFIPIDNFVYQITLKEWHCALCKHSFSKTEQDSHKQQESHKNLKKLALRLLRAEEPFIYLLSQKSKSCMCSLCDSEIATLKNIIPHCRSEAHKKMKSMYYELQLLLPKILPKESLPAKKSAHVNKQPPQNKSSKEDELLTQKILLKNESISYDINGCPYCNLCKINLQNKNNLSSHINGAYHKKLKFRKS